MEGVFGASCNFYQNIRHAVAAFLTDEQLGEPNTMSMEAAVGLLGLFCSLLWPTDRILEET